MAIRAADFDAFYQATAPRVVTHMFVLTGDLRDAEEVAGAAYACAWRRWDLVADSADRLAWVRTVATGLAIARRRRAGKRLLAPRASRVDAATAECSHLSSDHVAVAAALRLISPVRRRAVVLHHLMGMTEDEIVTRTGGTSRERLHDGLEAARHALVQDVADVWPGRLDALLDDLAQSVESAVQPMPPAALRARTERARTQRRAMTAAVAAVAVLVAGGLGVRLAADRGSRTGVPAGGAGRSVPPESVRYSSRPVSAHVLRADRLTQLLGSGREWRYSASGAGPAAEGGGCAARLDALGAHRVARQTYVRSDGQATIEQQVGTFDAPASALRHMGFLSNQMSSCSFGGTEVALSLAIGVPATMPAALPATLPAALPATIPPAGLVMAWQAIQPAVPSRQILVLLAVRDSVLTLVVGSGTGNQLSRVSVVVTEVVRQLASERAGFRAGSGAVPSVIPQ